MLTQKKLYKEGRQFWPKKNYIRKRDNVDQKKLRRGDNVDQKKKLYKEG